MATRISKKRHFIKNGLMYAEMNSFFQRMLADDGYIGLEIRPRGANTDIVLIATRSSQIIGENGRRIRELTALTQRKFLYDPEKIHLYAYQVSNKSLSATAQCDSIRQKLAAGIAVRRACYTTIRTAMKDGARGVEVIVSGKIRGQRAKSMKFVDGVMIHSGHVTNFNVDSATKSVLLKQGVLGIKVKINKPFGREQTADMKELGPEIYMPDTVTIKDVKDAPVSSVEPYVQEHPNNSQQTHSSYSRPTHHSEGQSNRGNNYRRY